jgi:hypothetical protein
MLTLAEHLRHAEREEKSALATRVQELEKRLGEAHNTASKPLIGEAKVRPRGRSSFHANNEAFISECPVSVAHEKY